MLLGQLQANSCCKTDHHLATTTAATMLASSGAAIPTPTAAEMASYLQQLQTAAEANSNSNNNNGARGEQCPRCASHDTKFCYYNNYNTSQPRHFCRACRRYWTLGGSLRNVPIGGSTRKRPRLAPPPPPASRRHPVHVFSGAGGAPATSNPMPPPPQGLLGSLFALGAGAPLLEGRGPGFDLGLGLPVPSGGAFGELGAQMQGLGLGLRGGLNGGPSAPLLWPAGLLDNDGVDAWKLPQSAPMWPEFSAAAAPTHAAAGGLLHGGAQLM
ncbi:hypothetical protein EJB05_05613, partial [Eragrostis curvula]